MGAGRMEGERRTGLGECEEGTGREGWWKLQGGGKTEQQGPERAGGWGEDPEAMWEAGNGEIRCSNRARAFYFLPAPEFEFHEATPPR